MILLEVLLFLLLCALALGWASRRLGLPYPIALVVGGGLLGFIPRLPQLDFDPQFLLVLVLPPILYQAALLTSWRDFKASLRTISLLAIGLVLATTLVVGAALKALIPEIPWAAAFVFGAIVSPPDAVAATAILSRLNMPRRIVTVLEGESLVNDASGLVLYKFAVAAVLSGTFSLADASIEFVLISAGGIAIGMLLGGLFVLLHRYLGDPFIEVLLSLSVPYMAYVLAESVGASGVLAVVAAGLLRGRYSPAMVSAEMRILARSVWNILVFMLNSLIFILIGLQLSDIVARLKLGSDPGARAEQRKARLSMGRAALAAIEQHAADDGMPAELAERIGAEFGDRMAAASPLAQQPDSAPALAKRLRLAAVRAERDELIRMWRNAEISDDVLHHLEEELDYEESRL